MNGKKLTSIRWRLMQYTVWVCLGIAGLFVGLFLSYYDLTFRSLFTINWFGVPFVIILLVLTLAAGLTFGYLYGHGLKKRLETLANGIIRFQHGNYSYRIPHLGEDELGLMATYLNEMAERVEKQVASLQKLSSEKAEWDEQLKKSVISEERQRLARELHDAVSQQLFAISMMTAAIRERMNDADDMNAVDDKVKKRIASVEKMAGNAQNEMRALLLHLRPATLEGKGLGEGLKELLAEFEAKQPMDIDWEITGIPDLSKGIEDHLFRIAQEGLSNVFRHSEATSVSVRLSARGQQLYLKIIDNGIGFDMKQSKPSSYGLQSIQERANEIGGVAEIISFPGKGTHVEVKVPIVNDERERER